MKNKRNRDPNEETQPAVSVQNLTKIYQSGSSEEVCAVNNLSFEIPSNSIVGLLGPNGAGKTTTIKTILGLVLPTDGEIRIFGEMMDAKATWVYEKVSAVLEGARNIYWRLTPLENMYYFLRLQGRNPNSDDVQNRIHSLLNRFDLDEKKDVTVNKLSRGMKQKVSIASAFVRNTPVLFLDEPTLGLDVQASFELQRELRDLMEEHKKQTIILSSHNMDVVQNLCRQVIILKEGKKIVHDQVSNLIEEFQTQTYRIEASTSSPETLNTRLNKTYQLDNWNATGNRVALEVTVKNNRGLYRLIDILKSQESSIQNIRSKTPDLEEVFLELTNNERNEKSKQNDEK